MTDPVLDGPVPSFNLLSEPWIQVRLRSGVVLEVSIEDAFRRAEEIKEIVGEVPTQSFAITRLLLAILYRALEDDIESERDWQELWQNGLPPETIDEYLDEYRSRFDLLDAQAPFFQVADLHTTKNEFKTPEALVSDVPSNSRLFTTRAGKSLERLSFAEATRWLINVQAFDFSGIKSGAVGDPRLKGGKGYPIGVGWSGLLGGVLIEGKNFAETLLLNLVPTGFGDGDWSEDHVPWEKAPHGPAEESEGRRPTGPADLYTWQSRRIRLHFVADAVVGCLISNGDKLTPQNMHDWEPMTAWRRSDPQAKKLGLPTVYMPREHDPARAFWRGIAALLPKKEISRSGKSAATYLAPKVLDWLANVQDLQWLPADKLISVRAIGVLYGTQSSSVAEIIDDRLDVSLALLAASNVELANRAEQAVVDAEGAVFALKNLAANLARAAGGTPEGPRARVEEVAYAALDHPYRHWLRGLRSDSDPMAAYEEWQAIAKKEVLVLANELLDNAGPAAWKGRVMQLRAGGEPELVNSGLSEIWFRRALWKIFGQASGHRDEEDAA